MSANRKTNIEALRKQYNPDGLSFESIRRDLNPSYFDALQSIEQAELDRWRELAGRPDIPDPCNSEELMIDPKDEEWAQLIKAHPVSLVLRPEAAKAAARWLWLTHGARNEKLRAHGKRMLEIIKPNRGRPPKSAFTPEGIARACDQCETMLHSIKEMLTEHPEQVVQQCFPGLEHFEEFIGAPLRDLRCKIERELAIDFIVKITGDSRTLVARHILTPY